MPSGTNLRRICWWRGWRCWRPTRAAHGESLRRVRADGGFDFETDRAGTLNGWPDDVAAAIAWLTARGDIDPNRIGVGGASVGATRPGSHPP